MTEVKCCRSCCCACSTFSNLSGRRQYLKDAIDFVGITKSSFKLSAITFDNLDEVRTIFFVLTDQHASQASCALCTRISGCFERTWSNSAHVDYFTEAMTNQPHDGLPRSQRTLRILQSSHETPSKSSDITYSRGDKFSHDSCRRRAAGRRYEWC